MFLKRLGTVIVLSAATVVGTASVSVAVNPFMGSGFELPDADFKLLSAAAEKLYLIDSAETGQIELWENAKSGNAGKITLILKHEREGMPCRRLQHDIVLKKSADPFRFVFDRCKTSDGSWKLFSVS